MSQKSHRCSQCNKNCGNTGALLSHIKWAHEEKKNNYKCDHCGMVFRRNFNLKRHLQVAHNGTDANIKCSLCSYVAHRKKLVVAHYQQDHAIDLTAKTITFTTFEEFAAWKRELESKTCSHYIKETTNKLKDGSEVLLYSCHRDGDYVPKGNNKRRLKAKGSNKINAHCPAQMTIYKSNEGVRVNYIDLHIGHELELERMNMSQSERAVIAEKLAMKVPFHVILDEIHDSVRNEEVSRFHLTSRQDLWNIVRSFNINKESVLHKSTNVSVDAWISHMQSSSNTIRMYKPLGKILENSTELTVSDFFLVIMNEAQKELLDKYGNDCICVDRTHDLNAHEYQLYTVTVLDDLRQGFPCAFLFSNREDTVAMELFFRILKESLEHPIATLTFMSDMDDIYYNAWCAVMHPAKQRLYCSWHIDRAWRKALSMIKNKEQQAVVYKKLKMLMYETNEQGFNILLVDLFTELNEDPTTKEFGKYFETYMFNASTWAYCYRKEFGINTNMILESMHSMLKHIYFDGEKVKRLDKAIHMLMKYVRDKLFARFSVLKKDNQNSRLKKLITRHKRAVTSSDFSVLEMENFWIVQSTHQPDVFTVTQNDTECNCMLRCNECNACTHAYQCSCIDSAIKWYMCRHIHLVCIFLKKQHQKLSSNLNQPCSFPSTASQVQHINAIDESFTKRKQDALDTILKIYRMITTEEQLQALVNHTTSLERFINKPSEKHLPILNCMEPASKNIQVVFL